MKKRPFILLEVLLAFLLVLVCAVPLTEQPIHLFKEEINHLQKMEEERLADWTFTEIKEMLLKNEILWEKIPAKKEKTAPFELSSATIEIPGCASRKIERSFILTGRGEIIGKDGEIYRQLGVYVYLNKNKYSFRIPVQKLSIE